MNEKLSRMYGKPLRSRPAFTLVELMIVVAIIAVLAAVAVPAFTEMKLRAQLAEGRLNMESILDAGKAYMVSDPDPATNNYFECNFQPREPADLDKEAVAWPPLDSCWNSLGWQPDGQVRCAYYTENQVTTLTGIQSIAACNLDADSEVAYMFHMIDIETSDSQIASRCGESGTVVYDFTYDCY